MNQENSIEIVSVTFGAGDSRLFALTGEYFEIIEAPTPVDVVLSDFNGSQRARMSQASASFYSKGVKFGVIQITSAGAQTIRFAYGSGETGTRRSSGSVTISGNVNIGNAIALDAATLLALEQINVRPEQSTGNYKSQLAVAANTAETIFTAGANANGAIILSGGILKADSATVGDVSVFLAKATAPTSVIDGEVFLSAAPYLVNTNYLTNGQLPGPQYVAPGMGLFFLSTSAVSASPYNLRHCRFRLF